MATISDICIHKCTIGAAAINGKAFPVLIANDYETPLRDIPLYKQSGLNAELFISLDGKYLVFKFRKMTPVELRELAAIMEDDS